MGGIGITELLIVLAVVLIIFGGRRLPQLGRDLGAGMRGFKDSITGKDERDDDPPALEERATAAEADATVVDGEIVRDRR